MEQDFFGLLEELPGFMRRCGRHDGGFVVLEVCEVVFSRGGGFVCRCALRLD
jgi:hypothetical protein